MPQEYKLKLVPHINYLENELQFLPKYKKEVDWRVYQSIREKRLEIERWTECLINATLDISKILITYRGEDIPETSREILFKVASLVYKEEEKAETFSKLAKIRNTLARRYLDIRWQDIKMFFLVATEIYPDFLEYIKKAVRT